MTVQQMRFSRVLIVLSILVCSLESKVNGQCWTRFNDTNLHGADRQPSITSEDDCRSGCISNSNCVGVDWNTVDNSCWFASNATNPTRYSQAGITHWDLNRTCNNGQINSTVTTVSSSFASSTTTFPTAISNTSSSSTGPAECWTRFNNTNLFGADRQSSITSEDACRSGCFSTSTCIGVDWNTVDNSCWFASNATNPTKHPQNGITHWDLNRTCINGLLNGTSVSTTSSTSSISQSATVIIVGTSTTSQPSTGPAECWTRFNNTNLFGADRQSSIASEDACRSGCFSSSTCIGVDWNTVDNSCWFASNATNPTKHPQNGITHWDLNRTCISGQMSYSVSILTTSANFTATSITSTTTIPISTSTTTLPASTSTTTLPVSTSTTTFPSSSNSTAVNASTSSASSVSVASTVSATSTTSNSTSPPKIGGCTYNWTLTNNSHISGGVFQSLTSPSENNCLAACQQNNSCVGVDWNRNANECWFMLNTTDPTQYSESGINHWDLTRFCLDQDSVKCPNVWSLTNSAYSPNGRVSNPANREDQCKEACVEDKSCTGVDWTSGSSSCYLSTTNGSTAYSGPTAHWDLTRMSNASCQGVCISTWTFAPNKSSPNAFPVDASDEVSCRAICVRMFSNCNGVDFTSSGSCLVSTTGGALVDSPGIDHWTYGQVEKCADNCTNIWNVFIGYTDSNAVYIQSLTTTEDCRTACTNDPTCSGFEFTSNRCLFSTRRLSWVAAFANIHNEVVRSSCGSGCSGSWLLSTNMQQSNRVFYANTTELNCKNACVYNGTSCTGIDYVPSTTQCFLGFSSNLTTAPGTNHFERITDLSCVSAKNPTTVVPVQSTSTAATATTACVVQWENITDANSIGCTYYSDYKDVESCASACLRTVQYCVVANFNVQGNPYPNECWLCLNSNGTLPELYSTKYVNTYRIKSRC